MYCSGEDGDDLGLSGEDALLEVKVSDGEPFRVSPDPKADNISLKGLVMGEGEMVRFFMSGPEGTVIKRIEIRRR